MNTGETINYVRKQKNLTINDLCGNLMSRTAYNRFVNGDTDTSSTNFLFLLDRLNISVEEFMLIKNNFKLPDHETLLKQIHLYFSKEKVLELEKIKAECDGLRETKNDRYTHLYYLVGCYINLLNGKPFDEGVIRNLKDFFINIETWTYYEIILFNNVMFIFDLDMINIVLQKAINKLDDYDDIQKYTSQSFKMLSNIFILHYQSKNWVDARRTFNILKNHKLTEEMLFEKNVLIFFEGLILLLVDNKELVAQGRGKIGNSILIFEQLQSNGAADMHRQFYNSIK